MASDKVLKLRFNQSHDSFVVCLESGVRVYNVEPLKELAHLDVKKFGTMGLGEMLFRTNLLALVGGGPYPKYADNTVLIYDDELQKFVLEYTYATKVLAIRVNKTRIIVALRQEIHVFSFPNQNELLLTCDTGNNPLGLLEFTPGMNCDRNILCFPAHKQGAVQIVDLAFLDKKISYAPATIYAHKTKIACLSLNQDGSLLATSSERGTIIRIWDTIKRINLTEFRRGSDMATHYCLNFSGDNEYFCCSSDKGTVHIFALKNTDLNTKSTFSGMKVLGKYIDSQWALTNFTVPPDSACICAFGSSQSIYAICQNGSFYKYLFQQQRCNEVLCENFTDICSHWFI